MSYKQKFSGSFVALITPMLSNGEVDYDSLTRLINWHVEEGTDGLVVLGTTAETVTLSKAEKRAVLEHAIEINAGRLPLIVGNGSNCTATTIQTTKDYQQYPIDAFLTVTPYYNKPNQKGVIEHFKAVAEVSEKPIFLYNVPGRTNVDLTNESVETLMSINNIVGLKDATGDLSRAEYIAAKNPEFVLLSGDDLTSRAFVEKGGHGTISVTANVAPKQVSQMIASQRAGNSEQATNIDAKLVALHSDLFIEPNPVPTKFVLADIKKINHDTVRLPLVPMELNNKAIVKQAFAQSIS